MKELMVSAGPTVQMVDSPIPEPITNTDVVIKVEVSGSNPKDWKVPEWLDMPHNSGDDIAGVIHKAGAAVQHLFKPGDRVAAFHRFPDPHGSGTQGPHGSYAEYAVAPAHTTMHLPHHISFEEAATIPLAVLTACVGLFVNLGLPEPWTGKGANGKPEAQPTPRPIIIYGAASAVGNYAIQLAKHAGLGPLFCVAGRGISFVEKMLDKSQGDIIVDYRKGNDAVVSGLREAAEALPGGARTLQHAFDCVSDKEKSTYHNIGRVLESGKITTVLTVDDMPSHLESTRTMVGSVHAHLTDFGKAWFQVVEKGLVEGWFKTHPAEVVQGGLDGVETALKNLKSGKASAVKYVFRIADTPQLRELKSPVLLCNGN